MDEFRYRAILVGHDGAIKDEVASNTAEYDVEEAFEQFFNRVGKAREARQAILKKSDHVVAVADRDYWGKIVVSGAY